LSASSPGTGKGTFGYEKISTAIHRYAHRISESLFTFVRTQAKSAAAIKAFAQTMLVSRRWRISTPGYWRWLA
jgi:hypothetical protein